MKVLATIILGIFGLTEVGCADRTSQDRIFKQEQKTIQFTKAALTNAKGIGRKKEVFYIKANLVTPVRPSKNVFHLLLAKK